MKTFNDITKEKMVSVLEGNNKEAWQTCYPLSIKSAIIHFILIYGFACNLGRNAYVLLVGRMAHWVGQVIHPNQTVILINMQ